MYGTRLVLDLPDGNKERNKLSEADLYKLVYTVYTSDVLPALGNSF